ncbi:MFS transporter [Rhizohabitans arisaemae]|uniref:MFS transporter n=1 Tax=Rhizohabitans arisaemae TaxID=2720610 RepID=UPI0024B1286D|nr:MFS transporter [Rhizohabitans arisaemae]
MDTRTQGSAAPRAGRREWLGLAVLALPTMLLSVDLSVLYLALPSLAADLGAGSTQQLWIIDVYGFLVAGFLITMGTLGDRIGRRKLLLIGAVAFGAASVLAAYSTDAETLIAARAVLGLAGATVAPSTLSLIRTMFADPGQRAVAVSVWSSCFMGGAIFGPIVGGVMLARFWWGSVFLLAVPIMLLLLVTAPVLLPEHRNPEAGRLDLISVGMSLAGILPVIYGITELARAGWRPFPAAALAVGSIFIAGFVIRQRKLADPLLDLRLFEIRTYRSAFALSLLGGAVQGGSLLLINLYLQTVLGMSTQEAGLWLVPTALAMVCTIMLGSGLAQRIRPGFLIAVGMLLAACGYALLTQVPVTDGLTLLLTGFGIAMAGMGPGVALGYDMIIGSAPPEKAGSAAAMVETGGQFGVALGVAVLGSLGGWVYRSQVKVPAAVPAEAAHTAQESVVGAASVAPGLPGPVGTELLASARDAFTAGLNTTAISGAILFLALAALAAHSLRHVPPTGAPAQR